MQNTIAQKFQPRGQMALSLIYGIAAVSGRIAIIVLCLVILRVKPALLAGTTNAIAVGRCNKTAASVFN